MESFTYGADWLGALKKLTVSVWPVSSQLGPLQLTKGSKTRRNLAHAMEGQTGATVMDFEIAGPIHRC